MSLEIQSQNVALTSGSVTTFNFDYDVTQYVAGIASFLLTFGDDDHHVEQMSISLQVNKPSSRSITVRAIPILNDASGNSINLGDSYVTVAVLAWTGTPTTAIVLSPQYTIGSGESSSNIPLQGGSNPTLQAVCCGFNLTYGDDDHEVAYVQASVGAGASGNQGYITASASMNDSSGNRASDPTAIGALIATSPQNAGIVVVPYSAQNEAPATISMGYPVSKAVSLLTGFQVRFPSNDDHHIRTIGAGPNDTQVNYLDNTQVVTSGVWAWMYDDSDNNQDDNASFADIVVIGLLA